MKLTKIEVSISIYVRKTKIEYYILFRFYYNGDQLDSDWIPGDSGRGDCGPSPE